MSSSAFAATAVGGSTEPRFKVGHDTEASFLRVPSLGWDAVEDMDLGSLLAALATTPVFGPTLSASKELHKSTVDVIIGALAAGKLDFDAGGAAVRSSPLSGEATVGTVAASLGVGSSAAERVYIRVTLPPAALAGECARLHRRARTPLASAAADFSTLGPDHHVQAPQLLAARGRGQAAVHMVVWRPGTVSVSTQCAGCTRSQCAHWPAACGMPSQPQAFTSRVGIPTICTVH